jgi:HK97 family phage portal protein
MAFDFMQALGGKALSAHPALMDRSVPVSVYSPGASRQDAKLSQREALRHQQVYGGSEAMDAVMNATDLYAGSAAGARWRLEKPDGTRLVEEKSQHDPKDAEVGPEDLYELLKHPNPFMLYDELVTLLIIDLLMVGNGYWMKWRTNAEGKPLALYRLAPAHVKIIPGPYGPKRYEYQPPGVREPLKLGLKDIVHFKLPNPHDAYYGMGVIRKGGRAIDLEIAVTDTVASYMENKADPSLIVQSDRRVPRDVFNKLRAQLRARISGTSRAGELLVLEAGLKAETLSPSARDAMFKELSGMSQQRVYAMFRTHPKLFGISTQDSGTDKVSDARREFDTYVMRPFLDKLERRITEYVVAAWDLEFKIDYSYMVPQDELLKNISTVAAIPGIKVRELRRALLPLGFLDGESTGDAEIDEEILNMPMEEMDENGAGGAADRPLAGEAGRPPKGENTSSFKRTRTRSPKKAAAKALDDPIARLERALDQAQIATAGQKALEAGHGDNVTISVGRTLKDEERPEDRTLSSRTQAVDDLADFIRVGLADEATKLERAMLDHAEGKAFTKSDVVKRMRQSEAWVTFREGVERILAEAGQRAMQASVMDQASEGRVADDLDYDAITKSVIHRKEGLPSILRTAKKRLIAKVANLGPEATKADADKVIQEHLADWKVGHAESIAISEAVELYNEGTLSVAEATGAEEVYVFEEEDAPDTPCQEARGMVWPIEYAREHRKEHTRCRRAFAPIEAVA